MFILLGITCNLIFFVCFAVFLTFLFHFEFNRCVVFVRMCRKYKIIEICFFYNLFSRLPYFELKIMNCREIVLKIFHLSEGNCKQQNSHIRKHQLIKLKLNVIYIFEKIRNNKKFCKILMLRYLIFEEILTYFDKLFPFTYFVKSNK